MRSVVSGPTGHHLARAVQLIAVLHVLIYAVGLATGGSSAFFTPLYYVAPFAAIAGAAIGLARLEGRSRAGIGLLAASVILWLTGDLGYSAFPDDTPLAFDGAYYLGYLTLALGVLLLGLPRGARPDWQALLDGAAVFVVTASLAWRFLVTPLASGSETWIDAALVAGYPVADLAVLAVLLVTAVQRDLSGGNRQFTILGIGVATLIATDAGYAAWSLHSDVPNAMVLDLGWIAFYWLFALATLMSSEAPHRTVESTTLRSFRAAMPYIFTVPFAVIAFADASKHGGVPVLLGGLVIAVSMIMVRQWLTLAENARLQERLAHAASHDSLTGLLNHRAWWELATASEVRAVALIDIDHFKRINDSHGHAAGDYVLVVIAERIQTAFPGALAVGRLGGEEFGVLFSEDSATIAPFCEQAIASIASAPVTLRTSGTLHVGISVGLADVLAEVDREQDMIAAHRNADLMLYQAKAAGRRQLKVA